jgi:uncharacterized protein YdeI (BOF family)
MAQKRQVNYKIAAIGKLCHAASERRTDVHQKDYRFRTGVSVAFAVSVTFSLIAWGCGGGDSTSEEVAQGSETSVETSQTASEDASSRIEGEIVETMDSGGYTYALIRTPQETVWTAGPISEVSVGENVSLSKSMRMGEFRSETLDRTFENIYFVTSFGEGRTPQTDKQEILKKAHGGKDMSGMGQTSPEGERVGHGSVEVDREVMGELDRVAGGQTVAEIYASKTGFAGKLVKVRGVVVKFTPGVMGANWIHLQDGTCEEASCDLTVTTAATVKIGDLVVVEGTLTVDKDFGAGYSYEVIIEGATVVTE